MAKPGKVVYNFVELDRDKEFQKFLKKSLANKAEEVDFSKYEKGLEWYGDQFLSK